MPLHSISYQSQRSIRLQNFEHSYMWLKAKSDAQQHNYLHSNILTLFLIQKKKSILTLFEDENSNFNLLKTRNYVKHVWQQFWHNISVLMSQLWSSIALNRDIGIMGKLEMRWPLWNNEENTANICLISNSNGCASQTCFCKLNF